VIDAVSAWEQQELVRRERLHRGDGPQPDVSRRTVILVDDGLATGSTMLAAIQALRQKQPACIVAVVPTVPPDVCEEKSCEDEVIKQLVDLRRRIAAAERRDGGPAEEEAFYAEQNACAVLHAEQYYRSMFLAEVSSWNLRDRHMSETLEALAKHLRRQRREAKIAVWAHNSHVGDARVTEMSRGGVESRAVGS
jgi:hypothetical protein